MNEKCPLCDDVGFEFIKDEDGIGRLKRCSCVDKKIEEEIKKELRVFANIPKHLMDLKIKDYDISLYKSSKDKQKALEAKKIANNYIKNYDKMKETQTGLYFYSKEKGSGKTRLAVGVANALMEHFCINVKFCTMAGLLREIKSTFSNNDSSTEKFVNAMQDIELLVIDDFGSEKPTEFVNDILYEILNERMLRKNITIYTSNLKIEELRYDSRIISRVIGTSFLVNCPEEDLRISLRAQENASIKSILLK